MAFGTVGIGPGRAAPIETGRSIRRGSVTGEDAAGGAVRPRAGGAGAGAAAAGAAAGGAVAGGAAAGGAVLGGAVTGGSVTGGVGHLRSCRSSAVVPVVPVVASSCHSGLSSHRSAYAGDTDNWNDAPRVSMKRAARSSTRVRPTPPTVTTVAADPGQTGNAAPARRSYRRIAAKTLCSSRAARTAPYPSVHTDVGRTSGRSG